MSSRFVLALASAAALLVGATPASALPPIKHVFIIVLENQDYAKIFGADTVAPYLGLDLPKKGAMLNNYYATGHASLGNYVTMISGQPESPTSQADCRKYVEFTLNGN